MGSSIEEQIIYKELLPVIEGLGFSVVELKAKGVKGVMQVHLVIYRPEGVSVEDCTLVHSTVRPKIEVLLDTRDIQLEVASPGIGRKLKSDREFAVFKGLLVRIWIDEQDQSIEGEIKGSDGENVVISTRDEQKTIPLRNVRKAKLI